MGAVIPNKGNASLFKTGLRIQPVDESGWRRGPCNFLMDPWVIASFISGATRVGIVLINIYLCLWVIADVDHSLSFHRIGINISQITLANALAKPLFRSDNAFGVCFTNVKRWKEAWIWGEFHWFGFGVKYSDDNPILFWLFQLNLLLIKNSVGYLCFIKDL